MNAEAAVQPVTPILPATNKWQSAPVTVHKSAPSLSSVHVGKDGVQTHINEGWIPYWRLCVNDEAKKERTAKSGQDNQNFYYETKEQLTAWWLKLVEESADAYLTQQWGFDFAAVPYHYIDQPPKSMPAIKRNLDIVHTILSALAHTPVQPPNEVLENNRRNVRAHLNAHLFAPVTAAVYKAIDNYSHGVKTYLWHECHSELDRYDFSMTELFTEVGTPLPTLEEVFLAFKDRKERESARLTRGSFFAESKETEVGKKEKVAYVESLAHEIWYIREMKRLEQGFFALDGTINPHNKPPGTFLGDGAGQSNSSSVSDIVPISGLILSKFHRLENELKTIIEHWGRRK